MCRLPTRSFQGHDPLKVVADLPRLVTVDFALVDPTGTLDSMNTFNCGLEIRALMDASVAEVRTAVLSAYGKTEIIELTSPASAVSGKDFRTKAISLLEAQLLVLQEPRPEGIAGRIAAAGRTAGNALLYLGMAEASANLDKATAKAQAERKAGPLVTAIERMLSDLAQPDRLKENSCISRYQMSRWRRGRAP